MSEKNCLFISVIARNREALSGTINLLEEGDYKILTIVFIGAKEWQLKTIKKPEKRFIKKGGDCCFGLQYCLWDRAC